MALTLVVVLYTSGNIKLSGNVIKGTGNIITQNYVEGNVRDGYVAGRDINVKIKQNLQNCTVHGSVVAAEKIEHSFNNLQESKANDAVKNLLEELLLEIKALNEKVPASQELSDIVESTETLINESKRGKPRKE